MVYKYKKIEDCLMGKKSNAYILLYHSLIPKKLPQVGSEISDIHNQVWEPVTAVWRNAWRDAGVYMNYNNQYKCNGSYIEINHLYLPETILTREYEVGKNLYTWKNVLHIKEKYNGDGTYTVTRKKDQGNLSDEDLIEKMVKKKRDGKDFARIALCVLLVVFSAVMSLQSPIFLALVLLFVLLGLLVMRICDVEYEYQYINGQLSDTVTLNSTELKPTVDKVIVKGDKEIPNVADLSYWAWPTEQPYTITTYYGYRWGSMHAAIDIYGPGHGSSIYAANNGIVTVAAGGCVSGNVSCNGKRGNYIIINHNAGYYTVYMHLSTINVKVGQTVARGQKIGTMGNTGEVYPMPSRSSPYSGTHLHFATTRSDPSRGGLSGSPFNPLTLYR